MLNSKTTSDQLIFNVENSIPLNQDKTSARATCLRATTTLTDTVFAYTKTLTTSNGLVQLQDKIVLRFALTIYPYSLGVFLTREPHVCLDW
jgi:hypothetical protein